MRSRPLFWKIYPYYIIIIVASLALTAYYGAGEMRKLYISQITSTLQARAQISSINISPYLETEDKTKLTSVCREIAKLSGSRITIIKTDGVVLGDSHEEPGNMENHRTRPEIVQAIDNKVGVSTRYSSTLQASMMYVAVPVVKNNNVIAIVRASVPVSAVEETLASFYRNIMFGGLLVIVLAGLVSMLLFQKLTTPLKQLRDGAVKFAEGDFNARLGNPDIDEIADLSESMKRMASQLDSRISMIASQRNEREAILSSMSEGVMAIDNNEKIVSINRVASDLLGVSPEEAQGSTLYELVRIPALLKFVEQASRNSDITETEINLSSPREKILQVHAASLSDNLSKRIGTVLVFNDITRLKKLEGIRREFVANVSHELKTPITAIAGSAETLLEGDDISKEDQDRFLRMIARQSDRLKNLIDDLLSLARLESDSDKEDLKFTQTNLAELLKSSVSACQEKSIQQGVNIQLTCESNLEMNMNRSQLEQAIVNLLDNALKYSNNEGIVHLKGERKGDEIIISVTDQGSGISEEHLPRLFERFYRVDHARSREAGGTGLGLSIVKHIALAHRGRVGVDSKVGSGSTFTVYLPVPLALKTNK